jgi:penicillin-binding protein 1C
MKRFRFSLSGLLLLLTLTSTAWASIPSFPEVKARWVESDARFYDRRGKLIQVLRSDSKVRRLGWTELGAVSPALVQAVIASEDRGFYAHHGVDWWAIADSAKRRILHQSSRGASTLSMQLAALLSPELMPGRRLKHRSLAQKLRQILAARELEGVWSKEQILEAYLNLVDFRGELEGIRAGAEGLFGKAPSSLNHEESLVLAALIRSPDASSKAVSLRACDLGRALERRYDCQGLAQTVARLRPVAIVPEAAFAPHVARKLLAGTERRLTLDLMLQTRVLEILREHVLALKGRNMNDAAALVVENSTGNVLAYVGSLGDLSAAGQVDGVQAPRQAGSTLKPFLYSIALEQRYLTASSLLDDSQTDIPLGDGAVYRPRDFDREYHGGDVTLRTALASSLNVPAVRTLQMIGVDKMVSLLGGLGFRGLKTEEFYGPSLALGSADVTLWDLVNGYRTLANGGLWSEMRVSAGQTTPVSRRIVSASAAFVVDDILSDNDSRSLTFGLDSPLALPFWSAVKTGTSKDMRDNWCVGFSGKYTVGVWAGNFSGKPMWDVSGVSGAGPAWAEIMRAVHQTGDSPKRRPPRGLVQVRGEWYLRGTEPYPPLAATHAPVVLAKITYPAEGLVIASDPDIPAERQRVFFETNSKDPALTWILNGKKMAHPEKTANSVFWTPSSGNYELKLLDTSGHLLDEVHFSVRGHS